MNNSKDIRWQQRFSNYKNAFERLAGYANTQDLNELEKQGLIKAFEYTYELAWKTLQDLLKHKGYESIVGPKPVIEKCFELGYITKGKDWVRMHKSRNLTSHIYNEDIASEIISDIKASFIGLFYELKNKLDEEIDLFQKTLFND